jgi:hypothetical protein
LQHRAFAGSFAVLQVGRADCITGCDFPVWLLDHPPELAGRFQEFLAQAEPIRQPAEQFLDHPRQRVGSLLFFAEDDAARHTALGAGI